jgi:predicted NBD/HSP70 family sugar kinase
MDTQKLGIGIDVGGTKVWAVLGNENGDIVYEYKEATCTEQSEFLNQLDRIVNLLLKRSGVKQDVLCGIGIGLPGIVSSDTGVITWVPNLMELNGLDLGNHFKEKWGLQVSLQNDGKTALIGEQWLGAAKGRKHIVMITIGTGIGGAVMMHGKLWDGAHGIAGSMGWMIMDLTDDGDEGLGWFERTASGTAINRRGQRLEMPRDSHELFAAAVQGDQEAMKLAAHIGHCIGAAVANITSVLDPELIVIGGGVSRQLDVIMPSLRDAVRKYASPAVRDVPVTASQLLDRSGVMGALGLSFILNQKGDTLS